MNMLAQCRSLGDGRLHFQHGPMDIVIGAEGAPDAVRQSHAAAWERFRGLLQELVAELPALHNDPFDRLLVAQALAEPLRLITHDAQVARYSDTIVFV